jgi:hypothetical protein
MGGTVPLGYDLGDRRLVINQAEASLVRQIYQRYLELGSVRLLKQDLDQCGVISKVRLSRKGSSSGGRSFSRGALYELLSNPIYLGEIRHKRERHPGQHQPILEHDLWEQVQHASTMARAATANRQPKRHRVRWRERSSTNTASRCMRREPPKADADTVTLSRAV